MGLKHKMKTHAFRCILHQRFLYCGLETQNENICIQMLMVDGQHEKYGKHLYENYKNIDIYTMKI